MSVLPPNSGELLRILERSVDTEIEQAIHQLYAFKSDPHDNLLYWLIWEYGLESVLPYSNDLRSLLKNGLNWQRMRGTPASLEMACSWLGLDNTIIEQSPPGRHFYEYKLNPTSIPGDQLLEKLIHVAQLSSPARSRLARVYHGYDVRTLHLSTHKFGHILSDDSGIQFNNNDSNLVNVSFARGHQYQAELSDKRIGVSVQRITARHSSASFITRLGKYTLGTCLSDHLIGHVQHQNFRSLGFELNGRTWLGHWENTSWQHLNYMLASHRLASHQPGLHRRHQVAAVCDNAQNDLQQSRSRTMSTIEPLSITQENQHHRLYTAMLPLAGQIWLGCWTPLSWQNTQYSIASIRHLSSPS